MKNVAQWPSSQRSTLIPTKLLSQSLTTAEQSALEIMLKSLEMVFVITFSPAKSPHPPLARFIHRAIISSPLSDKLLTSKVSCGARLSIKQDVPLPKHLLQLRAFLRQIYGQTVSSNQSWQAMLGV
jgi:hypothetical protein